MRWFGTNGIREVVGERLTPAFAASFATAVGTTFAPGRPIAIGRDGRTSSPALSEIVSGTLVLLGHKVVDLGLLPTPAIQYSVPRVGAQLGVIVTASHNPPQFNGFKCIASDGLEVTRDVEERIEAAIERPSPRSALYDELGSSVRDGLGVQRYLDGILSHVDRGAISRRKFSVVLDCANGASVVTSPELLRRLGCRVVTLNGHVDGTFPGRRSEPTEANLSDLLHAVPALGADLGIAHDGDADRAIFVDGSGRFVPGEKILTLLARDRVARQKGGVVVTPVSGTQALEEVVRPLGGEVVYTRVGSPSVTHAMQERSAVFGGEENGGLIYPELHLARDGAMTAAAMLDFLARNSVTMEQALHGLPAFTMVKTKVDCPVERGPAVLKRLREQYQGERTPLVEIDGLKATMADGWVLLRPSGTEPLIRVFAESRDPARAQALADEGKRRVEAALSGPSA
ncbi:MAG TPA: phosphoglucosamine mutase [Thermoplasmata archaeon]|nr:phosphoglucosamine mutase [Thermoplasmata archaeon]